MLELAIDWLFSISVGVLVVKSVMSEYLPDNWHFSRFMKVAWCYVSLSATRNKDNIFGQFCQFFTFKFLDKMYNSDYLFNLFDSL